MPLFHGIKGSSGPSGLINTCHVVYYDYHWYVSMVFVISSTNVHSLLFIT